MRIKSLRFEISILHTAILSLVLIIFSGVLYFISHSSYQEIDRQLKIKAEAVDNSIRTYLNAYGDDPGALPKAVQKTIDMKMEGPFALRFRGISQDWYKKSQALALNRACINFFDRHKTNVISSPQLDKEFRDIFLEYGGIASGEKMSFRTLTHKHKSVRVITYPLGGDPSGEYFIQVGIVQDRVMQLLRNWMYSILISVPLMLLLTDLVGRVQASRILVPVNEITRMAEKITHQDLSARITARHFDSEMGSLIASFNDMIARLEKSFKHIKQFSYHAAHEIRTPLTIIQGEADLMLRKDRPAHEYQQSFKIVKEESQRVLRTIDDLLLLTKLDYQPEAIKFELFDFMEFFREIVQQNRLLAAHKGIGIKMNLKDVKSPLMVNADRSHLRRLFFNIIGNAIKFTPKEGNIDTHVSFDKAKIIMTIRDTGPGIAEENLKKIFEEFFRADINTSGSGLGLNIANTIAKLHQGEIQVESQLGCGTTFRVILPSY